MTENEKKLKEIDDLLALREELIKKVEEEKKEQEELEFIRMKKEAQKRLKEQQAENERKLEEEKKKRELENQLYWEQQEEREKAYAEYMRENAIKHWKLTAPITKYLKNYRYIRYGIHYDPELDDKYIALERRNLVKELDNAYDDVIKYLTKEQIKQINKDLGFKAIKQPWF